MEQEHNNNIYRYNEQIRPVARMNCLFHVNAPRTLRVEKTPHYCIYLEFVLKRASGAGEPTCWGPGHVSSPATRQVGRCLASSLCSQHCGRQTSDGAELIGHRTCAICLLPPHRNVLGTCLRMAEEWPPDKSLHFRFSNLCFNFPSGSV